MVARHGIRDRSVSWSTFRTVAPTTVAFGLFASLALMRAVGELPAYNMILSFWGFDIYRVPFLDTETVFSALRCLRKGVDVYVGNPCDPLLRTYDYSPLWLALAALPVTPAWTAWAGVIVDLSFFCSLLFLPAGRSRGAVAVIVLATISSTCAYALERGNNDLVIFALAALAAAAMAWSPRWRLVGYGAALLAGLLKYYPMPVMILALRERPARFLALTAVSVVIVAVFLAIAGHDLHRALALIPRGSPFGDMFGATSLAAGVAELFNLPSSILASVEAVMIAGAFWLGIVQSARPALHADLDTLNESERTFLFVGGILVVACFMTAQSIGYRATMLLLAVPSLTALVRVAPRRIYGVVLAMTMALLWIGSIRQAAHNVSLPYGVRIVSVADLAAWFLREVMWWPVVTFLIACVAALIQRSEMATWVRDVSSRRARALKTTLT